MLNIYCVYWVDRNTVYSPEHVIRLRDQVAEHYPNEHRFICVTREDIGGDVETIEPVVNYPGWWQKIGLFSNKMPPGPNLYFDLDVALVGDIEPLAQCAQTPDGIYAPANWAQSGHGGIQSSVMAWNGHRQHVVDLFNPETARWPPVNQPGILWGDQEYLTMLRDTGNLRWIETKETLVRSYKYHCRGQGLPDDCRVVVFHGEPKPWQVNEPWLKL